jgi:hypothetical protein
MMKNRAVIEMVKSILDKKVFQKFRAEVVDSTIDIERRPHSPAHCKMARLHFCLNKSLSTVAVKNHFIREAIKEVELKFCR